MREERQISREDFEAVRIEHVDTVQGVILLVKFGSRIFIMWGL